MNLAELRNDEMPPRGKIFYHENTDKGMDSLLLFKVHDQIDGVDWCELSSAENSVA